MVNQDPLSMAVSGVVVVVLVDFLRAHQGWGWMRLVQGASAFKDTPGLLFTKVMGSGQNGGFSLRPSSSHQGLICLFDTQQHAEMFSQGPHIQAYQDRSRESWLGILHIDSARGEWDRQRWGATTAACLDQPLDEGLPTAALTRASIRPAKSMAFWRHAPAAQDDLMTAPGCDLAVGLGEAPVLRQATFSLWKNTAAMDAYARSGAHMEAIRAAWKHQFFSESMFVRFVPLIEISAT